MHTYEPVDAATVAKWNPNCLSWWRCCTHRRCRHFRGSPQTTCSG